MVLGWGSIDFEVKKVPLESTNKKFQVSDMYLLRQELDEMSSKIQRKWICFVLVVLLYGFQHKKIDKHTENDGLLNSNHYL